MNIDKPYTPELVSTRDKLVIPIYQRLFVWEDDRIRKLLDDLANAFLSNSGSNYYIGAITTCEKEDGRWEIVDGQQRLTFLTLLGCLLANRATKEIGDKWRRFVMCGDACRVKYIGREDDERAIKELLEDGVLKEGANERFQGFVGTFASFESSMGAKLDISKFAGYCWAKTAFLVNRLPRKYTPYDLNLYFEKMNSTGRQLTPIDVVKGLWFSGDAVVDEWNRCLDFDQAYEQIGAQGDGESLGGDEISIGLLVSDTEQIKASLDSKCAVDDSRKLAEHRLVMKPEVMLLQVLSVCDPIITSFDTKELISTFAKRIGSGVAVEKFIEELKSFRRWVDKNVIYLKDVGGAFEYAFRDHEFTEDDSLSVKGADSQKYDMLQFQSMLYVSSGESQKWVLDAYRACRNGDVSSNSLSIELLKQQDHALHPLDVNSLTYRTIDRYWFWRIDYELWRQYWMDAEGFAEKYLGGVELDERQSRSVLSYRFRRNVSIEHLHPQSKGGKDWGFRDDPLAKMHRLGNLAMMSVEANSAQSDDDIETKFGRVKGWIRGGRLESLKLLVMFVLSSGRQEGWGVDIAECHCDQMISLLKESAEF